MILAFQDPEFKIFPHFKILAFQNPQFKILAFEYPDFKIFGRFQDFSSPKSGILDFGRFQDFSFPKP